MDELSQLDELIESDVLDALGQEQPQQEIKEPVIEEEEISIVDFDEDENKEEESQEEENILEEVQSDQKDSLLETPQEESGSSINMDSTHLASLLSQLLNNKTIEITIKIKD